MENKIHKNDFDGNLVFGGKKFHLHTKRDRIYVDKKFPHFEYVEQVGTKFKAKEQYFEELKNCPLCGSENIAVKLQKDGLTICNCNKCSLGFQNPRFKSEYLSELYKGEYSLNGAYLSNSQNKLDEIKYLYALQECKNYSSGISSVLDIGAGNLQFLNVCKNQGIEQLYAIEPGSNLGNKQSDIEVITEFSDDIPEHITNMDLISMWDTLEHIHDFEKMVSHVNKALSDSGLFVILVPNLNSLASRLIRENSATFCIYHLNYFTENSLELLLQRKGFTVIHKETVISEIDNCRNYLEFQEPYMNEPKNEAIFDWLTPEYIHKNMLGSRLFFIAKKSIISKKI